MRTGMTLTVFAAVVIGSVLAGGCVSREEYDKLANKNRTAIEARDQYKQEAAEARAKLGDAEGDLLSANETIRRRDQQIALYRKANEELNDTLKEVERRYRLLLAGKKPPTFAEGPVLPKELNDALKTFATANNNLLEFDPSRGMVKFKSDLTFAKGSDYVNDQARAALSKFAEIINSPEASKFNIYIAGHTDDIPVKNPATKRKHPNNWYLSLHRAYSVLWYLEKAGVKPNRLAAMGFGEYHPIAPNKPNQGGNEKNRRVEIWIVPPNQFLTLTTGVTDEEPASGK